MSFKSWARTHVGNLKTATFHDWVMLLASLFIACATGIYTYFSGRALHAIESQLQVMQSSSQTTTDQMWAAVNNLNWQARLMQESVATGERQSKRAVETSEKESLRAIESGKRSAESFIANSRIELRAYLGPSHPTMEPINEMDPSKPIRAVVQIVNTGRTTGTMNYRAGTALILGKVPKDVDIFKIADWDNITTKGPVPIFPGGNVAIPFDLTDSYAKKFWESTIEDFKAFMLTHPDAPPPPQGEPRYPLLSSKSLILNGSLIFVYIGEITYKDIFNESHKTRFCGSYDSANKVFGACDGFPEYAN